jgi:hypothetical protein
MLLAAGLGEARAESASAGVTELRTKLEKWVETSQILSEERSEWEAEREILKGTQKLLRQQKESLEAEIAELEASNTATDEERRDLLLRRGEYQRAGRTLDDEIRLMEQGVLALAPRLPEPLHRNLEPLLVQIPEDPETTRLQLGQRLMNVLGVLAQVEKWAGTATLVGETRAIDGGPKVHVRTLYWGLAQAIYVDSQGQTAGFGRPGPDGWAFAASPELVEPAAQLLDIYEGNVDVIDFVSLPVEIR